MTEEKRPIEGEPEQEPQKNWEVKREMSQSQEDSFGASESEPRPESGRESKEALERVEGWEELQRKRKELEDEIVKKSGPEIQEKAKKEAVAMGGLSGGGKVERLVKIAKEKGVAFAISVAKDMQDPYLLDTLHDKIIENGLNTDNK